MRIAYARVSTDQQNLDRQVHALTVAGYDKLITEKYTGTAKHREGIDKIMEVARKGDTIIVESISRLGRNTLDILELIQHFTNEGIHLISLKENFDTTTSTGKAMLSMVAVIAQLERDMLVDRVKEGLASAKRRGVKLGRPALDSDKIITALKMYDSGEYTVKEITSQIGISQGKLYKEINKRKLR